MSRYPNIVLLDTQDFVVTHYATDSDGDPDFEILHGDKTYSYEGRDGIDLVYREVPE